MTKRTGASTRAPSRVPDPPMAVRRRRTATGRRADWLVALGALGAAAVALWWILPRADPVALGAGGATEAGGTRVVEVRTSRTRRVVVAACDRRPPLADVVHEIRPGDTPLTLRAGQGPRFIRVRPCSPVARVVLSRPAVEVLPAGAPRPTPDGDEAVQLVVVERGSRARTVVVPRCRAGEPARAERIRLPDDERVAVAPACS